MNVKIKKPFRAVWVDDEYKELGDDLIKRSDVYKAVDDWLAGRVPNLNIKDIPSADRPQGEWIDKAISIIDDMQREGIIDYEQAWEFHMRARMKGADNE